MTLWPWGPLGLVDALTLGTLGPWGPLGLGHLRPWGLWALGTLGLGDLEPWGTWDLGDRGPTLGTLGLASRAGFFQRLALPIRHAGSGVIDYTEFLAATLDKRLYIKEDVCWSAFRIFDRNGDGKISKEELAQLMGDQSVEDVVGAKAIQTLMTSVDADGDGFIDFAEFMEMMKGDNAVKNAIEKDKE